MKKEKEKEEKKKEEGDEKEKTEDEKKKDQTEDEALLNFEIGSGGEGLSAGEKALICICRAILRQNKIVILDEATASIDIETEQTI